MPGILNVIDGISPVGYDKYGPKYSKREVGQACVNAITSGSYFKDRGKRMSSDINEATELVAQAIDHFNDKLDHMIDAERKIADVTKQVSGKVKDTTNKLSTSLAKVESVANFDRLERYVELLERADDALTSLAELEFNGKLEKISKVFR